MKQFLVMALAVAVSGCAVKGHYQAYEGAPRAPAEQARVLVPSPGNPLASLFGVPQVRISCVDGKNTSKFFGYNSPLPFEAAPEIVVAPGRHNLTVTVRTNNLSGQQTVWFDAEAGRTYYARHEALGNGLAGRYLRVKVQDKESNKMISRVMDKEPDPKDDEVPADQRCRA